MTITTTTDEGIHTIKLGTRFDFNKQRPFRLAYEKVEPGYTYFVDFSETEYMDSSALGMLLLLRDYVKADSGSISLLNCREEIKHILDISHFEQYFEIS